MRTLIQCCLLFCGLVAVLGALACAFVTFATNDYRPIIAVGICLALTALGCFFGLIWWRRKDTVFYGVVGVLPSIIALAELGSRAISAFLR